MSPRERALAAFTIMVDGEEFLPAWVRVQAGSGGRWCVVLDYDTPTGCSYRRSGITAQTADQALGVAYAIATLTGADVDTFELPVGTAA